MARKSKWVECGDNRYERMFGPIKAVALRSWDYKDPDPSHYYAYLALPASATPDAEFVVCISELGVEWHDDKAGAIACRMLEKQIKAHIREWAK